MSTTIHVRHILVEHKYEAEDILRKLQQGEAFDKLAQRYSKCSSAKQGGDLGPVDPRRLDSDFEEAAQALKPHAISAIIRTKFGYHLIQRLA